MVWKKTQETKRCQSFMKRVWNWHFLTIFLSNFCQNSSRSEVDKNFAKFCQTFVNLLFFHFVVEIFWQIFVKSQKKIANEKSWQNFVKRFWNLFQCFVDDELCQTIVSVLRETTCKMLKNCHQNLVTSTMNNWHTQYFRDKHKCNIRLHFKNHVNSYAHD